MPNYHGNTNYAIIYTSFNGQNGLSVFAMSKILNPHFINKANSFLVPATRMITMMIKFRTEKTQYYCCANE